MFSKKVIIFSILFLIVLFIGISLLSLIKQPTDQSGKSGIPTPTPILPPGFSKSILNSTPFSPFQKTSIGETDESVVQQLPQTESTQTLNDSETLYSTSSVNPLVPDVVIVKGGVVVFEETSTFTTAPGGLPKLSLLSSQLGKPEETLVGNITYGPYADSLLYPTKGIVLVGNPLTDETYEVQRFVPTTLKSYKQTYGTYVQTTVVPEEGEL